MITDRNPIKRLVLNVITSGTFEKCDIEVKRKIILLNVVSIIAIINLIPLGIIAFIQKYPIIAFFDLTVAFVLIITIIYLRKNGYNDFVGYFGVFVAGALFLYLFITGGVNNTGHLWSYSFPVFALFLLGSKNGAIASLMLFVPSLLLLIVGSYPSITAIYTTDYKIRFIPSFLVVFGFSYFFEKLRERTQQLLAHKNTELEETISDLKQAQKALGQSEEKYRSMMESMKDPIYICSPDFRVEYMNPSMVRRTGHDATGEFCFKALHNLNEKCPWCKRHKGQQGEHYETEIVSPKDNRSYHVSNSPIIHGDGSISKMTVFRDTTDLKKLETQLQRSRKMEAIGTLAGGVAHDLNNILGGLVSYPELLLLQLPEESPIRKSILTIQKSGEKAAAVVQDLLTLARRGVVVTEVVNLKNVIAQYLESPEYERLLSYHPGVHLESHLDQNTLNITG